VVTRIVFAGAIFESHGAPLGFGLSWAVRVYAAIQPYPLPSQPGLSIEPMKYFSLKRIKKEILQSDAGPKRTAISLATGVALAFSPFPGLHLISLIILIKAFRLNGVVSLAGVLIHNPWTMVLIHFAGLALGDLVLHGNLAILANFQLLPWNEIGLTTIFMKSFWVDNGVVLKSIFLPFLVGSSILSLVFGTLSYRMALGLLTRNKDHFKESDT